jgi:hypothetical protein
VATTALTEAASLGGLVSWIDVCPPFQSSILLMGWPGHNNIHL